MTTYEMTVIVAAVLVIGVGGWALIGILIEELRERW